jgi:hypothetical protein
VNLGKDKTVSFPEKMKRGGGICKMHFDQLLSFFERISISYLMALIDINSTSG